MCYADTWILCWLVAIFFLCLSYLTLPLDSLYFLFSWQGFLICCKLQWTETSVMVISTSTVKTWFIFDTFVCYMPSLKTTKPTVINVLFSVQKCWIFQTLITPVITITKPTYEGHPISSDNGLISQKLLLKSEFYYPLHVAMDVAYSCLKYGVFIITWSNAIKICKQHCESPWPRKFTFLTDFCWGLS